MKKIIPILLIILIFVNNLIQVSANDVSLINTSASLSITKSGDNSNPTITKGSTTINVTKGSDVKVNSVTYSSGNTSIATVSGSGIVTAQGAGSTTISVNVSYLVNGKANTKTLTFNVSVSVIDNTTGSNDTQNKPTVETPQNHTHNYVKVSEKKATCTKKGKITYQCSCGKTKTKTTKKLGHKFSKKYTIDKKATCTKDGSKSKHCVRCNKKTSIKKIKKLGHKYTKKYKIIKKATCTANGKKVKQCTRCKKKSKAVIIKATGHKQGAWKTTQPATCTTKGIQESTCSKCKKVITKEIPATGHNYESTYTVDVKATCTTNGSKSKHCKKCGAKSSVTSIAATGHTAKNGKCTNCGIRIAGI